MRVVRDRNVRWDRPTTPIQGLVHTSAINRWSGNAVRGHREEADPDYCVSDRLSAVEAT